MLMVISSLAFLRIFERATAIFAVYTKFDTHHPFWPGSPYSCSGKRNKRNGCPGVRWRVEVLDQALEAKIVSVLFSERNFTNLERRLQAYRLKLATRNADQVPKLKAMLVQVEAKIGRVVNKVADDVIDDDEARGCFRISAGKKNTAKRRFRS